MDKMETNTMSNGKGSARRPMVIEPETFASNWEKAFNPAPPAVIEPQISKPKIPTDRPF
jgi:hypothetical protein